MVRVGYDVGGLPLVAVPDGGAASLMYTLPLPDRRTARLSQTAVQFPLKTASSLQVCSNVSDSAENSDDSHNSDG